MVRQRCYYYYFFLVLLLLLHTTLIHANPASTSVRTLRMASPLQALTLWDDATKEHAARVGPTPRLRWLYKFQAGLSAEQEARRQLKDVEWDSVDTTATSTNWADQAAAQQSLTEQLAGNAFDQAVAAVQGELDRRQQQKPLSVPHRHRYQFVGVIQPPSSATAVQWYARPKPAHARWSLRLLHVNRAAVLKDLYDQKKIDIYAKYTNTGRFVGEDEDQKTTTIPIVERTYTARERSWK